MREASLMYITHGVLDMVPVNIPLRSLARPLALSGVRWRISRDIHPHLVSVSHQCAEETVSI